MHYHSYVKGNGFYCEDTGKTTNLVRTDHKRWKECNHSMNVCIHCYSEDYPWESLGNALHRINESRKKESK